MREGWRNRFLGEGVTMVPPFGEAGRGVKGGEAGR